MSMIMNRIVELSLSWTWTIFCYSIIASLLYIIQALCTSLLFDLFGFLIWLEFHSSYLLILCIQVLLFDFFRVPYYFLSPESYIYADSVGSWLGNELQSSHPLQNKYPQLRVRYGFLGSIAAILRPINASLDKHTQTS